VGNFLTFSPFCCLIILEPAALPFYLTDTQEKKKLRLCRLIGIEGFATAHIRGSVGGVNLFSELSHMRLSKACSDSSVGKQSFDLSYGQAMSFGLRIVASCDIKHIFQRALRSPNKHPPSLGRARFGYPDSLGAGSGKVRTLRFFTLCRSVGQFTTSFK
jgi:hypothetical protein